MNGPTPSAEASQASAFPGTLTATPQTTVAALQPQAVQPVAFGAIDLPLPELGPIAPERPFEGFVQPQTQVAFAVMSYADERVKAAALAFAALDRGGLSEDRVVASWKNQGAAAGEGGEAAYVAAGSFVSRDEAAQLTRALSHFGRTSLEISELQGKAWYSVNLYADGRTSLDGLLEAAWANGAPDAMPVRD